MIVFGKFPHICLFFNQARCTLRSTCTCTVCEEVYIIYRVPRKTENHLMAGKHRKTSENAEKRRKTPRNAGKRLKICRRYCLWSTPTFMIFVIYIYKSNRSHADINSLT